MIIDTHAHIYANAFQSDREAMLERARTEGVGAILMPAIDSETHAAMLELEEQNRDCFSMMGVHPCSITAGFEKELAIAKQYLDQRKFIAVGEIGLDFYWDMTFKEQQYQAFQEQINWALDLNIPIVIHSRNATDECIDMVRKNQQGRLRGVFHCFSGTAEQARQVTDLGFYLGIGGVLTFKNGGVDQAIREIDLKHIILETDAPYLAPVPFRGKRNEPAYIRHVAQKLADLKESGIAVIEEITSANAIGLFRLENLRAQQ